VCGIAGILRVTSLSGDEAAHVGLIPQAWLDLLHRHIAHRGPDGHGTFRASTTRAAKPGGVERVEVALTHARLSIIDHAGGAQPMVKTFLDPSAARDARLAVVFNGCIYNHRALRRELEGRGARFASDHSDTEVLLHGYEAWGERLVDRLDGMWALAIWDGARGRLMLSRDGALEKPLYVGELRTQSGAEMTRTLWFASTASGVSALAAQLGAEGEPEGGPEGGPEGRPEGELTLDLNLAQWLRFGASEAPLGAAQSWPARAALHSAERLGEPAARWALAARVPRRGGVNELQGERLTPERIDALLSASVAERLEADVPLACFLSGGLDSGLVASHAQRALSARGAGPLRTFTVRMPAGVLDESPVAAHVAKHLGTQHQTLECHHDAAAALVVLIEQLGLPLGDSSLLPTYWISRAVREHAKVALSGDGGDELFGGYERQVAAALLGPRADARGGARGGARGDWRRSALRLAIGALDAGAINDAGRLLARGGTLGGRVGGWLERAARLQGGVLHGYHELRAQTPLKLLLELMPSLSARAGGVSAGLGLVPLMDDPAAADPLADDFFAYLGPDVLCKTDTASMAVGLELRSPMLARPLVEAALGAPLEVLMPTRGGVGSWLVGGIPERKGLLRRVAAGHLPADVLRLPKRGFAVPIGRWFREDFGGLRGLLQERLLGREPFGPEAVGVAPLVSVKAVREMVDEHLGTGASGLVTREHGQRLFGLLTLSVWAQWLGRRGPATGGAAR